MNTTKLLMAACLLLSIAACKKEDEATVTVKDKLMAKKWKSTGLVAGGAVKTKWCWLNSIYEYTESGSFYYTQGDDLGACSGANIGEISSFPYKLSADEKYLIILKTWPSAADTFEIISVSSELLKTKRVVNGSEVWEDTFTAQ